MPDPGRRFADRREPTESVGPYTFDVPGLAAGEEWILNLREYEENGTRGYYVVLSEAGYDVAQIENRSNEPLEIMINEVNRLTVPANTQETEEQSGMYDFRITNLGGAAVAADDVRLTILKEGYGADDAARATRGNPVAQVIENLTGVRLG